MGEVREVWDRLGGWQQKGLAKADPAPLTAL